jgi:hypothetical protein
MEGGVGMILFSYAKILSRPLTGQEFDPHSDIFGFVPSCFSDGGRNISSSINEHAHVRRALGHQVESHGQHN